MNIESAKVRDRTSDELLSRKNEFFKICDILEELNIDYYLHGGILLGAIRDQDFIRWDWGIDIRVLYNGFLNQINPLNKLLEEAGFEILITSRKKNDLKIVFKGKYPKEVSGYTIFAWNYSKMKDVYWRGNYSIPSKFFNRHTTISFLGKELKCPLNPEKYLTYAYGDWKIPIRTSEKNLYNSNNYYKVSFLRHLKNIVKKILNIN